MTKKSACCPSSPYAATKACSDHLANAWHKTYGLPVLITNCTNKLRAASVPRKLIPLVITKAMHGESIPVHGDGLMYAIGFTLTITRMRFTKSSHAAASANAIISAAATKKRISSWSRGSAKSWILYSRNRFYRPHKNLITHVTDRPGHDRRYALNDAKIRQELGWKPDIAFDDGLFGNGTVVLEQPNMV